MLSSDDEFLPSSQESQSVQIRQYERDASMEEEEDDFASPPAAISQLDENSSFLSEESSDQSETHSASRSNKYNGPESTWRSWTAPERELAKSLDQLTAQDLAVHLYNAHALKKRARKLELHKKSRLTDRGDDSDDSTKGREWMPPNSWTAWPLPAENVPRETDGPHWASQDFHLASHGENQTRSDHQELRDVLVAQVIKRAKMRNRGLGQDDRKRESPQIKHEAQSIEQSDESSVSSQSESQDELEPVIMLDDDIANNLLQPMVHHILAKLDGLLEGLHHARKAGTMIESSGNGYQWRKLRMPWTVGIKPENSVRSLTAGPETTSTSNSGIREAKRMKFRYRAPDMALRDWSDVVGVASMTGWDPTIVHNASSRCSTLFNEGIKFRRLEENGNGSDEISILPNTPNLESRTAGHEVSQHNSPSSHASTPIPEEKADPQSSQDESIVKDFRCPVSTCSRSRHGFPYPSYLKRHMKMSHPAGQSLSDQFYWKIRCPVSNCRRFHRGFRNLDAFKEHLKLIHPDGPAFEEIEIKKSEEEMMGGVHVDGFLQPIQLGRHWVTKDKKKPLHHQRAV